MVTLFLFVNKLAGRVIELLRLQLKSQSTPKAYDVRRRRIGSPPTADRPACRQSGIPTCPPLADRGLDKNKEFQIVTLFFYKKR